MTVNIRGVENRLAVPALIAKEALYRLKHRLVIPRLANKTYERYFEDKIGDTITVKRPFFAKVQEGRSLTNIAAMIDKTVDVKVDKRYHFALAKTDENATLDLKDYGARYLNTGVEELAYKYDEDGANELVNGSFFSHGTPGTAFTITDAQYVRARAAKLAFPGTNCWAVMDPLDIAKVSEDIIKLDMPEMVGKNVRSTWKGKLAGWDVLESVNLPYFEVNGIPSTAAPLVRGANQRGTSLQTDGWTNSGDVVLKAGQLFTIAGVYEVQPRGQRKSTGYLQTFRVVEDVTPNASGQATIKIQPEINEGTTSNTVANPDAKEFDGDAKANLDASAFQTVTATPADNAAITVLGRNTSADAKEMYRQSIFFCGDALQYINIELAQFPSAVQKSRARDSETGVALSYLGFFNGTHMYDTERVDIFYGVKNIYPEMCMRFLGEDVDG